jgi:hypothetical protein
MRTLDTLVPGERFRLPYSELTGTVIRQSEGGTTVRYDGATTVSIGDVTFTRPRENVVIASATVCTLNLGV